MEEMFAPIRPKPGLEERVIRGLRHQPEQKPVTLRTRVAYAAAAVLLLGLVGGFVLQYAEGGATDTVATQEARSSRGYSPRGPEDPAMDFGAVDGKPVPTFRDSGRLASAGEMARANVKDLLKRTSDPVFLKDAEQADHNETADQDDFKRAKGDSLDFVSDKPFKGKGTYDVIGGAGGRKPSPAPPPPCFSEIPARDTPAGG